jgi:hypothetical protein
VSASGHKYGACLPKVAPKMWLVGVIAMSRRGQTGIMLEVANWTTFDQNTHGQR